MDKRIVLSADLGGTNLRMAAVNYQGKILYRTKRETPNGESADEILRAMVESADECRANCGNSQVEAISAAVPGTIIGGKIVISPNLPALNNFQMGSALEHELGIESFLENDANAAAVGESWLGASKNSSSSVFITLGTGVGGGIIIDGRVLHGVDGKAGEIGHICVEPFGASCRCGSVGCVEQYASASGIVRLAKELAARFPESPLENNANLKAHEIFEAGNNGDARALEVFRQMGFYLGVAVSILINVMNPEVIAIGGGASAGWELFAPTMRETIYQRAFGGRSEKTKILRGELGDDAGILGAARCAFNLLNQPENIHFNSNGRKKIEMTKK